MSSRICITDTDNKVLNHVEEFGSITIKQCTDIFYNYQTYGYDISRKRLSKLVKYGKLKFVRDYTSNQNVYYMDKPLSYHDLLIMDFYAKLKNHGADIKQFKLNKYWLDNKLISDAFCSYSIGDSLFFNIVEVVKTHALELEKYKTLYDSFEGHKACDEVYKSVGGKTTLNTFPRIIVVDNVDHRNKYFINDDIEIIQLDFKLSEFTKIFLN